MAGRRLFGSRDRGYGNHRSFGAPEVRNAERELFLFRRRLFVAAALALLAFGGLFARFVYLQVVQHGTTARSRSRIASPSCRSRPIAA